ncbi:hypothetical protein VTN77DRAFT_9730 [Rasamsonia byssochlamydoides]|uniref:uncharacterized protein n=1 Tax=Rasamsonia byssochlamydoides TaxID=89139 RepID=UPI003741ECB6
MNVQRQDKESGETGSTWTSSSIRQATDRLQTYLQEEKVARLIDEARNLSINQEVYIRVHKWLSRKTSESAVDRRSSGRRRAITKHPDGGFSPREHPELRNSGRVLLLHVSPQPVADLESPRGTVEAGVRSDLPDFARAPRESLCGRRFSRPVVFPVWPSRRGGGKPAGSDPLARRSVFRRSAVVLLYRGRIAIAG